MAEDPYKVLGVARNASEDDIRRAYRKLAKENHPDLNPANKVAAEERLKVINAAFAIVGDSEKRRQFDVGAIDANGEPRRTFSRTGAGYGGARSGGAAHGADDMGFSDIFADLFGRARGTAGAGPGFAPKGQDVRYTLEVDFLEATAGAKKRVTLPDGGILDLAVPEGVADGQILRLKGKGGAGPRGAEPGDALVEIKVRTSADFKRTGDDIHIDVPITIDEAILGAKIEVPTIAGRVQLSIPRATSSGQVFRLKGKGVRNATTRLHGDQLVTVRIVLPATIDEKLAYFMTEWRLSHGYDAGRK
jgi:DnaJ-class molecular chaperone